MNPTIASRAFISTAACLRLRIYSTLPKPRFLPLRYISGVYTPPSAAQKFDESAPRSPAVSPPLRKKKDTTVQGTVVPQLSPHELSNIFSQELFVFRCDVTATQVSSAMDSYPQLRDVEVLTDIDVSNLARQLHTSFRLEQKKKDILPHLKTLMDDLKAGKIPGHPLASVHILSCLKDMEEFALSNKFWQWLVYQDETHCDARVYGAAIENFAYQGQSLDYMEEMYKQALERYSGNRTRELARDSGKATRIMLIQGIITARILHGEWRGAYEAFDECLRQYPTITPSRVYELFIYERPVKEAYIVYLMACRGGSPPKPGVLTPLLKELWLQYKDVRAMLRVMYAFVGAGGEISYQHVTSLITGVLGTFEMNHKVPGPEYEAAYASTMSIIRDLTVAFTKVGAEPQVSMFNSIISFGGKIKRPELVHSGLKELISAGLKPTIVTYRIILNAAGNLGNAEQVVEAWKTLRSTREELDAPWDFKDLIALVKACIATDQVEFARSEIEKGKSDMGWHLHNRSLNALEVEIPRAAGKKHTNEITSEPSPQPSSDPSNLLRTDVSKLSKIFSAAQIHDFTTETPAQPSSNPSEILNIDFESPSFPSMPETELQKFYKTLTAPSGSSTAAEDDAESSLERTATGYTIADLRFENWKSINRLLYEADVWEREAAQRKLEAMKNTQKPDISEVRQKKDNRVRRNYKDLFANEEVAKRRIAELGSKLESVRQKIDAGAEDWKADVLAARKEMGAGLIIDQHER